MSRFVSTFFLAALFTATFVGCSQNQHSSAPKPESEITLVPADEKDLDALIAKNKGKVVFIDYWATFCGPCKKAFPHTVELHKEHQAEGLVVISVNFDLLDDKDKALDFLRKQGATFDNL